MLVLDEKYKEFEGTLVPFEASPPGDTIEAELEARNISYADFAIMTELSLETIEDLIDAKIPITAEIAEKLYKALGIDAGFWMRRQLGYEYDLLVIAERKKQKEQEKAQKPNVFKRMSKSVAAAML